MATYARARPGQPRSRRDRGGGRSGLVGDRREPLRLRSRRALLHRGWPHLAWGYVDQPPLTPLLGHLSQAVFGPSPRTLRVPSVLAGMAFVVLTASLCRHLGGRSRAVPRPRCSVHRGGGRRARGDPHPEHHDLRRPRVGARAVVGDAPPPRSGSAPVGRGGARRGHRAPRQALGPVPRGLACSRDPDRPPIRRLRSKWVLVGAALRPSSSGARTSSGKRRMAGPRSTWRGRSRNRTAPRTGPS